MEVPLARRKIDRRDRIAAAAALLVPPAGIVQLNHALHNKLQLNIYSIGDQNAFSTIFFSLSSSFLPPFPFFVRVAAAAARQRNYLSADSWHKFPLSRSAWIGIASFFLLLLFFFFFFPPSIYITYHVGTSVSVFFGGSMRPSHFKFLRLRSFVFVFQI